MNDFFGSDLRRIEVLIYESCEIHFSRLFCRCERIRTMKVSKSIITIIVLLVMTFLVMGATNLNGSREDSIAQLKARINSLEKRVAGLEKKLQTRPVKRSSTSRSASRSPREKSLPRGWRRKEFNGIPYYIVPIGQKQSRSSQRNSTKSRR